MFLARFAKATETVGFPKPINKELLCLVMSNSSGVCMGWRFVFGKWSVDVLCVNCGLIILSKSGRGHFDLLLMQAGEH